MPNVANFSEYKTNDFLREELKRYEQKLEEEKKKKGRLEDSIFSACMSFATALFLYAIKDSENTLNTLFQWIHENVMQNAWWIILFYIALIFQSVILFLVYKLIFSKMKSLIQKIRNRRRLTGTINPVEYSPKDPVEIAHLFNHKVDDQISLAVSIFNDVEKQNSNELYVYDSFRHLRNGLETLAATLMVPGSVFMEKLKDNSDNEYSLYRIQELFNASLTLIEKIKKKWGVKLENPELDFEVKVVENRLASLSTKINLVRKSRKTDS